jgi:hypothetical protein
MMRVRRFSTRHREGSTLRECHAAQVDRAPAPRRSDRTQDSPAAIEGAYVASDGVARRTPAGRAIAEVYDGAHTCAAAPHTRRRFVARVAADRARLRRGDAVARRARGREGCLAVVVPLPLLHVLACSAVVRLGHDGLVATLPLSLVRPLRCRGVAFTGAEHQGRSENHADFPREHRATGPHDGLRVNVRASQRPRRVG